MASWGVLELSRVVESTVCDILLAQLEVQIGRGRAPSLMLERLWKDSVIVAVDPLRSANVLFPPIALLT